MATMTIYVPDELHDRIKKFKDNLNVSAIARQAFEAAVQTEELRARFKTDVPLEIGFERLLDSARPVRERFDLAWDAGMYWALTEATLDQLMRFRDKEGMPEPVWTLAKSTPARKQSLAEMLSNALAGREPDGAAEKGFLTRYFGTDEPDIVQLEGFEQGAAFVCTEFVNYAERGDHLFGAGFPKKDQGRADENSATDQQGGLK